MNFLKSIVTLTIICSLLAINTRVYAQENISGSTQLEWTELDGIIRYDVEIKDAGGTTVFTKSVPKPIVEFSLPPGSYTINITSINIFGKVSSETGWKSFTIKKKEVAAKKPKKKWKPLYVENLLGIGLKISAGYSYIMPLENWQEYYNDSYVSALFRMSLSLGELGALKKYRFFKYTGFELDAAYIQFTGKKNPGFIQFDSHVIPIGLNLFFTTGLRFPINVYIRGGGGLVFTRFDYYDNSIGDYTIWSTDPYALGGLSIEFTFYKYLFLEIGADLMYIMYLEDPYMGLRFFCSVGVRL